MAGGNVWLVKWRNREVHEATWHFESEMVSELQFVRMQRLKDAFFRR